VQKIFYLIIGTLIYLYLFSAVAGSFDFQFGNERDAITNHPVLILGIIGGAIFLVALLLRIFWHWVKVMWEKAKEGAAILGDLRAYVKWVLVPQMGGYAAKVGVIMVFLAAYGIPVTFGSVMSVLGSNQLANLLSFTPGGVGVNQAFNTFALESYTDRDRAAYSPGQLITTAFNTGFPSSPLVVFGWGGGTKPSRIRSGGEGEEGRDERAAAREEGSEEKRQAREEGGAGCSAFSGARTQRASKKTDQAEAQPGAKRTFARRASRTTRSVTSAAAQSGCARGRGSESANAVPTPCGKREARAGESPLDSRHRAHTAAAKAAAESRVGIRTRGSRSCGIVRGPGGRAPYWNDATSGSGVSACGERSRAGSRYLFHIVRTDSKFSRGFPHPESRNFDKLCHQYPQGSG
jgi:hypothetical protein